MTISTVAPPQTPQTALARERRIMRGLFRRLANALLNYIFALTVDGSNRRRNVTSVFFLLAGVVIVLFIHPLENWSQHLSDIFSAFFKFNVDTLAVEFQQMVQFAIAALTDPRVWSLIPVFFLPFFLSQHFAAGFLADVFELEDFRIARKFISEVSLGGGDNELRVSYSKIGNKEYEKQVDASPITNIGGPGYVSVDLDTAILVEKPDGRVRVIGPTHGESRSRGRGRTRGGGAGSGSDIPTVAANPNAGDVPPLEPEVAEDDYRNKALLDGFERIRAVIDLRDQVPNALEINSRSRDGIPVGIADVRLIFNIFRENKKPTPIEPHPFNEEAFRSIVFKEAFRVTEGEKILRKWFRSSNDMPSLLLAMQSLVTGELGGFISSRKLGEFLASIGSPEVDAIQKLEAAIVEEKFRLTGTNHTKPPNVPPPPPFTPRSKLSELLSDFTKGFNEKQKQRGVQAQWIGVGTWKMPPGVPTQVIPEKHIEAWRLTIENKARSSDQALEDLKKKSFLVELQNIIKAGPIHAHQEIVSKNLKATPPVVRTHLSVYINHFKAIMDQAAKKKERIAPSIVVAYYYLTWHLSHSSSVMNVSAPAPSSKEEERLYPAALSRVQLDAALEKLISLEEIWNPGGSRVDHLKQIIKSWDEDMADFMSAPPSPAPPPPSPGPAPASAAPPPPPPGADDFASSSEPSEEELYSDLLRRVMNDAQSAENLIQLESEKSPDTDRRDWIKRAIEKHIYDHSR